MKKLPSLATLRQQIGLNGFAGPFDTDIPSEILADAATYVDTMLLEQRSNPIYGRFSVRDYHLIQPSLLDVLTCDSIVSFVAEIIGKNLLLWRSKIFSKPPGEGPLGWHQEWGAFNGEGDWKQPTCPYSCGELYR